jgi:hypothetical protein
VAYKLKKNGRLVSLVISVNTRPDGQVITRRKTITGYEGDVFLGGDNLPRLADSVISRIEKKELDHVWEVVPDPEPVKAEETDGEGSEQDPSKPYDPGEHNQDEVLAYLATADDAEVERVKAAEAEGPKKRAGIAGFTKEPASS